MYSVPLLMSARYVTPSHLKIMKVEPFHTVMIHYQIDIMPSEQKQPRFCRNLYHIMKASYLTPIHVTMQTVALINDRAASTRHQPAVSKLSNKNARHKSLEMIYKTSAL